MKKIVLSVLIIFSLLITNCEAVNARDYGKHYDPKKVAQLARKKCKESGMITTVQNLKRNLKKGKITQEEYLEYYPLDGLEDSYYSVFVNADLRKARTTSGRRLTSTKRIVDYLAGMMLLEEEEVFYIRYSGVYKNSSGQRFYEFRCYR